MNSLFYERDNIKLIIGVGDGMRNIDNKMINEIEAENLHIEYNAFICNPINIDYYPINLEYLSKFKDDLNNTRDYQMQICDLNDNQTLNFLEEKLINKIEKIDIQQNTWYFFNNTKIINTFIKVLKIGGKFTFPFSLNNTRCYFNNILFKKIMEDNIEKLNTINIIYSERTQKYICFKNGNIFFPNSLLYFNSMIYGKKELYFNIIKDIMNKEYIIKNINEFKKYFDLEQNEKIEFSERFNHFHTHILKEYNDMFLQHCNILNFTENDIQKVFCDIIGLKMLYNYFLFFLIPFKILIDIDTNNNLIIERIQ